VGIRILLTVGLLVFLVYATSQRDKSRLVFYATLVIGAAGLFFVWMPEEANDIAYLLGVGRGADLILYCWILTSLIMGLNLHLLIRENQQIMTELARRFALAHPIKSLEQMKQSFVPGATIENEDDPKRRESRSEAAV
jgi:hypothetical protein